MTIYAYFDSEPLPVAAATAQKFPVGAEGQDKNAGAGRRNSLLSIMGGQWAGRSVGSAAVVAGDTLRQKMVHILSNRNNSMSNPSVPFEGTQDRVVTSVPQAPVITTTHGKLVVVVTDNGPGIIVENQKRLFKEVHTSSFSVLPFFYYSLGVWLALYSVWDMATMYL